MSCVRISLYFITYPVELSVLTNNKIDTWIDHESDLSTGTSVRFREMSFEQTNDSTKTLRVSRPIHLISLLSGDNSSQSTNYSNKLLITVSQRVAKRLCVTKDDNCPISSCLRSHLS